MKLLHHLMKRCLRTLRNDVMYLCALSALVLLKDIPRTEGSQHVRTVELKSNKLTTARDMVHVEPRSGARVKRSYFDSQTARDLVDRHNQVRRLEASSNMEFMVWNDYLAEMAADWADLCIWDHGQPERNADELPFPNIGQNLYIYNGTFDAVRGVQLWYDEVEYYDFDTGDCSHPPCGHYTQVTWASSSEVGCAYNFCPTAQKVDIINGHYLVCNYGPGGNFVGEQPHRKGQACSQCDSGRFWCDDGLCRSDCTSQSTKCECRAACQNCGDTIRSNCSCSCHDGWTGPDCSEVCEDKDALCGANPGWPFVWCGRNYVAGYCPLMCQLCRPASGSVVTSCELNTVPTVRDQDTTSPVVAMTTGTSANQSVPCVAGQDIECAAPPGDGGSSAKSEVTTAFILCLVLIALVF